MNDDLNIERFCFVCSSHKFPHNLKHNPNDDDVIYLQNSPKICFFFYTHTGNTHKLHEMVQKEYFGDGMKEQNI